MGFYLFDHPPARSQGAPRSAWGFPPAPSGVVAVHDTEGVMDDQGDDWGAENTAAYIVTRSDPGSYHEIHDGDSVVVMAPDSWMTWNVAADSANGHNWGISAACRTSDWDPDADWTRRVIRSMGRSIAAFWARNGFDVATANRWITRDEANRRIPGLILHGTWQPGDRSDAWATHPRRPELDRMLVDAIAEAAGLTDHQPMEEEELMGALDDIRTEFTNQDARTRAFLLACFDAQLNHLHATVDMATARLADLIRAADSSVAGADIELRDGLSKLVADLETAKRPTMAELVPELAEPAA